LKTLRWDAEDLAAILDVDLTETEAWLDGRNKIPISVAAWLEALVRAHLALPPPLPSSVAGTPVEVRDEVLRLENDETFRRVPAAQGFYPSRNNSGSPSSVLEGSNNGSHPL
jgi:hypothetical protein